MLKNNCYNLYLIIKTHSLIYHSGVLDPASDHECELCIVLLEMIIKSVYSNSILLQKTSPK